MVEVKSLNALIQYQEGSIVSKTLLKADGGSLTLFAFDKGQELSEHTTPYDAGIIVFDGEAEIFIDQKAYTVKSGEWIPLPANRPHAVKASKRFKMALAMIKSRQT
ncbi:MAG: cupin domain-containing protein [Calditrichaeota bacterium]|nr:cupin domain-containing protein [Calditrichota bacterium]